ncbi:MAG: class I SAM-dependent methyltransferase [Raineya sp.]|nr:class I SAM-dependent methyltransferase [Raineya sp.]
MFSAADNTNPNSFSSKARRKRFQWFLEKLNVQSTDKILDVGGTENIWIGTGLEKNVTLLNIDFKQQTHPDFRYVIGNACQMDMFQDKEFDIVFSNSVIEHVGKGIEQKLFAKEVQRVAKKYWVQTPYLHFPLEPHFLFPFFQYFPEKLKLWVGLRWKYSHLKKNNENIPEELSRLKLLNKKELKSLFPDAQIIEEKIFFLTKSIIAYKA